MIPRRGFPIWEERPRLPKEYQEVSYIGYGGSATRTAYIDTTYNANSKTSVEIDCILTIFNQTIAFLFGYDDYNGSRRTGSFFLGHNTTGDSTRYDGLVGNLNMSNNLSDGFPTTRAIYKLVKIGTSHHKMIDDIDYGSVTTPTFQSAGSLLLFTAGYNAATQTSADMDLYECKIREDETIMRHFIPCVRKADSVVGLYNLAYDGTNEKGQAFYTNSGSGSFIAGEPV